MAVIGDTFEQQRDRDELRDYLHKLAERHGEYFDEFSQIPQEGIDRLPKCLQPGYVPPVPNKIEDAPDQHPEVKPFKHRRIGWSDPKFDEYDKLVAAYPWLNQGR